jgi:hypothetical protein
VAVKHDKNRNFSIVTELAIVAYCSVFIGFVIGVIANDGFSTNLDDLTSIISATAAMAVVWIAFKGLGEYRKSNIQNLKLKAIQRVRELRIESNILKYYPFAYLETANLYRSVEGINCFDENDIDACKSIIISYQKGFVNLLYLFNKLKADLNPVLDSVDVCESHYKLTDYITTLNHTFAPMYALNLLINKGENSPKEVFETFSGLIDNLKKDEENNKVYMKMIEPIRKGVFMGGELLLELQALYQDLSDSLNKYEQNLCSA